MSPRLLRIVAIISAVAMAVGLLGLDRPLAEWVRASGIEQARVFSVGLDALDTISGMRFWVWLAGAVAIALGLIGLAIRRAAQWPRVLVAAGLVQYLCIATMILGKQRFGRLRPEQVLASGDWSHLWFAGGTSFPSGHSAFYFGLLLPLAAACTGWSRAALLAIPVYAVLARIDLAKHFLSDVSASALMAALYALLIGIIARRWLPAPTVVGARIA